MKLKEITPKTLQCCVGPCFAVFETDSDIYVIIGKNVDEGTRQKLKKRIGKDETAVEVPRAFFLNSGK